MVTPLKVIMYTLPVRCSFIVVYLFLCLNLNLSGISYCLGFRVSVKIWPSDSNAFISEAVRVILPVSFLIDEAILSSMM